MNTSRIAQILNIKDEFLTNHEFRRYFRLRIRDNIEELPSVPSIAMGPAIDENTIVKLNELMSTEEKRTFLTNVLHFKNIDFNIYYLILNSPDAVRKHIMEILTHSALGMSTLTFHFYDIANIYLYILANSKEYTCKDVLQHLKNGMIMYDSSVIEILDAALDLKLFEDNLFAGNITQEDSIQEDLTQEDSIQEDSIQEDSIKEDSIKEDSIKEDSTQDKDDILDTLKLKTDEQLEQKKNDFFKQIEEQEQEQADKNLKSEKIIKILGISLLCQVVLVAFGLPPFTRIVNKAVKTLFDFDK